jgi:hypothetical protein
MKNPNNEATVYKVPEKFCFICSDMPMELQYILVHKHHVSLLCEKHYNELIKYRETHPDEECVQ